MNGIRHFFPPQFAATLSGEFTPTPRMPELSVSLLQIASLAITDGRWSTAATDQWIDEDRVSFFYNPPWAPRVQADCFSEMHDGFVIIDTLFYVDPTISGELVINNSERDGVVSINNVNYEVVSLQGIAVAKAAATEAAQQFFDTVFQKSPTL